MSSMVGLGWTIASGEGVSWVGSGVLDAKGVRLGAWVERQEDRHGGKRPGPDRPQNVPDQ